MNQTILVTGASSGFGLLIASKLHQSGYHVIGTSRDPQKYQADLPYKLLALDIADKESIKSSVKAADFSKPLLSKYSEITNRRFKTSP